MLKTKISIIFFLKEFVDNYFLSFIVYFTYMHLLLTITICPRKFKEKIINIYIHLVM